MPHALTESPDMEDEHLDAVFNALANRTRRAILSRLTAGSATVTELAEPFDMTLPAVSKHLRVLEEAEMVVRSVQGRVHRCALPVQPPAEASKWFDQYRAFWTQSLDSLARYAQANAPKGTHR